MRVGKASTSTPCAVYQARTQPAVAHMRVGKASTSTPCACCIRHKPSLRSQTCVSEKQAQAQLVRVVSGTNPACGSTHAYRKSKHKHSLCVLYQAQTQPTVAHMRVGKSKHKHTLCTLYQTQAQPAVAHMRIGKASTSTACACCIRHKPSLR